MSDFRGFAYINQIQVTMPCTGQLGGSFLEASGRVKKTLFRFDDKSPKITDQHTAGSGGAR